MWNYQNKLVSLKSNVSSNVKVRPFKYEGTGLQSIKQINWKPQEKIKFTLEGTSINLESSVFQILLIGST